MDVFQSSKGDLVQGNYIGLNASGTGAVANGAIGVRVNQSSMVTVGGTAANAGNDISGNSGGGVNIAGSSNCLIAGNQIGLDYSGEIAVPNKPYGILVENGSNGTTIGGTTAAAGNIVSGNSETGILVKSGSALILGNKIGTNFDGNTAVGNGKDGVLIQTNQVTVGGTTAAARNVISGNKQYGIYVNSVGTAGVTIQGNYIGTNAAGSAALANQASGVNIINSNGVTVGGTVAGAGNVVSGNTSSGVAIGGGSGILVAGNMVGTDALGATAVANAKTGIFASQTTGLTIGGTAGAARNIVSGNQSQGINLTGGNNILVQGNSVGLNAGGTTAIANASNGIETGFSNNNFLTNLTVSGNAISGNGGNGLRIFGVDTASVVGNFIGTNAAGTMPVANAMNGITVGSSSKVTIGGTTAAARNVISGNQQNGILLFASGPVTIQGNHIGTNAAGDSALGNGQNGISASGSVDGKANHTIGGTTTAAGNVISGNGAAGILANFGTGNQIGFNRIGTNAAGTGAIANAVGINLSGESDSNSVFSNLISGNTAEGLLISSNSNQAFRNTIGLNLAGTAALANGTGVKVSGGNKNVIGAASAGNVISGNTGAGVLVEKADGTNVLGNFIGTSSDGGSDVGNGLGGVVISTGATNTTVGGTAAGALNVISGNTGASGVRVQGNAKNTLIQANFIGLNSFGTGPLANERGITVQGNADNTTIGGTVAAAANIIGFNDLSGITVTGAPTDTRILGNRIGVDKNGAGAGNLKNGITLQGGLGTTIGGSVAAAGNVISGNNGNGIQIDGAEVKGVNSVRSNLIGTNVAGSAALANGMAGVFLSDATGAQQIGLFDNTISGNTDEGVFITSSEDVAIGQNIIGLNKLGTAAVGNGSHGVLVVDSSNVTIGGPFRNIISGNGGDGVHVGGGSTNTTITNNNIGLLKGADQKMGNAGNGINITDTASNTTIGGLNNLNTNIISGNTLNGVNIDANTVNTLLNDNIIGMNDAATVGLGNTLDGIHILGKGVIVNGNLQGVGDWIAGNGGNGILVSGANASGTIIRGARIGTNGAGTAKIANALDGILVTTGADNVIIGGGLTNGENRSGNLVSGNTQNGIHVVNAAGTTMRSNLIGTDKSGEKALGNTKAGVFLDTTNLVTIGGNDNSDNTISANGEHGIVLSDATSTTISFNEIDVSFNLGKLALGNTGDGINVTGASTTTTVHKNRIGANTAVGVEFGVNATGLTLTGNIIGRPAVDKQGNNVGVRLAGQNVTIGGTTGALANGIFGNVTIGIDVQATTVNVGILGNFIGISSGNSSTVGNGTDGILVSGLAKNVTIGGSAAGARNIISGNKGNGIHLQNVTQAVQIIGNFIGTGSFGSNAIGNDLDGILLDASGNALIQGNVISGNGKTGVDLKNGSNSNVVTDNNIGIGFDGKTKVSNGDFGVWVHQGGGASSSNNTIGGTASGAGNVIAYNTKGVVIGDNLTDSSQQNSILGNSIFKCIANGVLDLIDLGNNGPTYTPSGTSGPNLLEVVPTLTLAKVNGSDLNVHGQLNGTLANTTYRIEFFAGAPDAVPFARFLGSITVTTDASGNVVGGFNALLKAVNVPVGTSVSATATDQNGNTTGLATAINAS